MIEILAAHGFHMWSKTCSGCPGPQGTKWKLGRWSITEYPGPGIFYARNRNIVVKKGKSSELNEYIEKNIKQHS